MRPYVSPFRLGETSEMGTARNRPRLRAKSKIIFGICLRRELEGIALAFSFPFFKRERSFLLIKYKQPNLNNTPKSSLVENLVEKSDEKPLEPWDIQFGTFERKGLEPEEIGEF